MSIVSCPRCGDKVSLPPATLPSALVQCPLCLEEYFLSDALIQLPPMLVVVGSRPDAAEKEGEYRLAEPVVAAVSEAQFEPAGTSVAPRPQLKTVSRRRPQERSAIGEIVKVVLGGVAGLAGGLLVLWWGFGVDVGDLGPQVSKVQYLRFLVPPSLRSQTPPDNEPKQLDTMNADSGQGKGNESKNGTNGGLGQGAEAGAGADGNDESRPTSTEVESQGKPAKGKGKKGKKGKKQPEDDPFAEIDLPGAKPAAGDSPELKIDDPLSAIKPKQEGDKPKEKVPPPTVPEGGSGGNFGEGRPPTQAELARRLGQSIEGVSGSIDALETVNRDDGEAVDAALKYVYDTAARLTIAVLEMDRTSPEFDEQRQSLNDCLRRLARDSRRTDVIGQRARIKLDDTATKGSWILLAGTVTEAGPAGEWFQTMVEATDDERLVAVLTADDPHESWKVGDLVIVLGRVVHDPVANAKGYVGDAEVAVTSAHGVTTRGGTAAAEDAKTEDEARKTESSPDRSDKPAAEKPKPAEPKADEPKDDKPTSDDEKPAKKDTE